MGARKYGGGMESENIFFKVFEIIDDDFETTFTQINKFLEENGYSTIDIQEFDLEMGYDQEPISLSLSTYQPEVILFIKRDVTSYTQLKYLTYLLKKSDIKYNSSNIGNKEDAEKKITNDLINSLLLADKFEINIEELILSHL
jgi:hypothetical protein